MLRLTIIFLVFMAIVFMYANVAKAQLVKDGLVAYWPLDKNTIDGKKVKDVIGGNDGTMNASLKIVAGKVGDALEFNGVTDKVDIPGTDALDFNGKEKFSVSAWIYAKGTSGGTCCGSIVAQRDVNAWALRWDNRDGPREVEFIVCPGWVGDGSNFGLTVPLEEWHLVTGVCTGKQLLMYLDDKKGEGAEIAFPGAVSGGGFATTIGGASDGYFNGIIDEALIYNKALSDKEIAQNFQAKGMAVDPKSKLAICWGELKKQRLHNLNPATNLKILVS